MTTFWIIATLWVGSYIALSRWTIGGFIIGEMMDGFPLDAEEIVLAGVFSTIMFALWPLALIIFAIYSLNEVGVFNIPKGIVRWWFTPDREERKRIWKSDY